jgi:hypothetical protein
VECFEGHGQSRRDEQLEGGEQRPLQTGHAANGLLAKDSADESGGEDENKGPAEDIKTDTNASLWTGYTLHVRNTLCMLLHVRNTLCMLGRGERPLHNAHKHPRHLLTPTPISRLFTAPPVEDEDACGGDLDREDVDEHEQRVYQATCTDDVGGSRESCWGDMARRLVLRGQECAIVACSIYRAC